MKINSIISSTTDQCLRSESFAFVTLDFVETNFPFHELDRDIS